MTKLLLDTGVWISYFNDRSNANDIKRTLIAKDIINYSLKKKHRLFYCPYVENELSNGKNPNRTANIEKMRNIAHKLPAHIGNDTIDQVDINWEDCGSSWDNNGEEALANDLELQLPDKRNKSNRIDRNIILTAVSHNIDYILHENPTDYKRITIDKIILINLLNIDSLDDFINFISHRQNHHLK